MSFRTGWFPGALAVSAFCCFAASGYQASEALQDFRRARDLFNQQEWDKAKVAAGKALAADPSLGDAEILLGLIATVQSRFDEAEGHLLKAVALEPENYQAHAYLGSTYLQEKKLQDAAAAFKKVLTLNPGNVAANYNLGVVALEEGSAAEAMRRFESVLSTNRSDVPALTGVLSSELMLHRVVDARRTAEQLQRLLADNDPRLQQVAALLAQHGDSSAAIPVMERIRRAFPQSWEANYNLAVAYFQTTQYDRAADTVREFTGGPGKPEAFDLLGAIEEKRGRKLESEHAFEQAVAHDSSNEEYCFDYGNALLQHGKSADAVRVFRAAVSGLPTSWKLKMGLGSAYYLAGDYENAAASLLEAVRLKPDSATAWFLLGEAYESAPGLQGAIEAAFASHLASAPHDAWAYCHYGAILYQRAQTTGGGHYQEAIRNLNQALRLNPDLAQAHFELGLIALAEGNTKQSIAALEKALTLEPGLSAAHYRLGLAYRQIGNEERARQELKQFQALKQEERQRGRVLQSLTDVAASAPGSAERP